MKYLLQEPDGIDSWLEEDLLPDETLKFNRLMGNDEEAFFHKQLCSGNEVRVRQLCSDLLCCSNLLMVMRRYGARHLKAASIR